MFKTTPSNGRRFGVSLLELTACILAVAVGVWLGARYLGLNLHAAAYTAVTETKINDQLPEGWKLTPPAGMEPLTADEKAVALNAELEALRYDVSLLSDDKESIETPLPPDAGGDLPPDLLARRQHTLAFWSQLGGIREEVDRLQAAAEDSLTHQNVYQVLEIRRRANQYGAKAVEVAMHDAVDPLALQFAEHWIDWYKHGADLYGEAMSVWQGDHPPVGGLSSDQFLEQVQQQHDNEARLLFQKSGRLSEVLSRRYQVAFPEIDDPTVHHR